MAISELSRIHELMFFWLGLALQLIGFASVGLCLFAGMQKGDYEMLELYQFIGGSAVFYIGHMIKGVDRS